MKLLFLIALTVSSVLSLDCTGDYCTCPSGEDVDRNSWCDNKVDCIDAYDEADETCKFYCNDAGNTIVSRIENGYPGMVCDGNDDCLNGADEFNCEFIKRFVCGDNQTITQDQICNGVNDCTDGLDEAGCGTLCNIGSCSKSVQITAYGGNNATVYYTQEVDDSVKNGGTAEIKCGNDDLIGQFTCNNGQWEESCPTSDPSCWSYLSDVTNGYYKGFQSSPSSFGQAEAFCASKCAQLVTLHSSNEENHAVSLVTENAGNIWLGMTNTGGKGTAATKTWLDGTPVNYEGQWHILNGTPQPSCDECESTCSCVDCVEIMVISQVFQQWNDAPCTIERAPMCAFYVDLGM